MPFGRSAYLESTVELATTTLSRRSVFDAPLSGIGAEQNEEFSKTRFIASADSALSMSVDPLGILLAQSFANHLLQFGVRLDFS
jgi:hypothetical protein